MTVPWPLGSRKIHVINAESPDEIWIRDDLLEEKWYQEERRINDILLEAMKSGPIDASEDIIGKTVAVDHDSILYRGYILSEAKGQVTCRLVDFGKVVKVPRKYVRHLPKILHKNMFCVCAKLSKIASTGTGDPEKWSMTSKDTIRDIMRDRELYFQQEVRKIQEILSLLLFGKKSVKLTDLI